MGPTVIGEFILCVNGTDLRYFDKVLIEVRHISFPELFIKNDIGDECRVIKSVAASQRNNKL